MADTQAASQAAQVRVLGLANVLSGHWEALTHEAVGAAKNKPVEAEHERQLLADPVHVTQEAAHGR